MPVVLIIEEIIYNICVLYEIATIICSQCIHHVCKRDVIGYVRLQNKTMFVCLSENPIISKKNMYMFIHCFVFCFVFCWLKIIP